MPLAALEQPINTAKNIPAEPLQTTVFANGHAQCLTQFERLQNKPSSSQAPLNTPFSLLNWNIYKAQHADFDAVFKPLAAKTTLIVLQEALAGSEHTLKPHHYFSPGYNSALSGRTGLLTLSNLASQLHCNFQHIEPWLRTPKASSLDLYPLSEDRHLMLINLHAVNFSLGVRAYAQQLADLTPLMAAHSGPLIVAGDFNAWNAWRTDTMEELMLSQGLHRVQFPAQNDALRKRFFGYALDYIWQRGLRIEHAEVLANKVSDHNALWVQFKQ